MRRFISPRYVLQFIVPCIASILSHAHGEATYVGLVTAAGHDDHAHTGLAVVQPNDTGNFTARIQWQGMPYRIAGTFGDSGVFRTTLRKRRGALDVEISAPANGVVAGSITDGAIISTFAAAAAGISDNPTPLPRYNGLILDNGNLGFLVHSAFSAGVRGSHVYIVGKLNDGTPFATGTWVIPGQSFQYSPRILLPAVQLPIYFGVYGVSSRGSVWGELSIFAPPAASWLQHEINGTAQWYRPVQPTGPAPNTAGQTSLFLYGADYAPGPDVLVPENNPSLPEAQLFLLPYGGDYEIIPLDVNGRFLRVVGENPHNVQIRTFPQTGFFAGSFTNWLTGKRAHFSGFVRPGLTNAMGNWVDRSGVGDAQMMGED